MHEENVESEALKYEDDIDPSKVRCLHERFTEKQDIIDIINSLVDAFSNQVKAERAIEKFTLIVDAYQEQPHMLDPYLEEIVNLIISKARDPLCHEDHMCLLFVCLYLLTKMRGYKVIIRWLPHEVSDVETVLELLARQDPSNVNRWQVRYCLLLWLSMVSLIPFDLVRLDNHLGSGDGKLPVMDRILNISKEYLTVADKSCDAAAFVLAKFLTRPDVKSLKLDMTIKWACDTLRKTAAEKSLSNNALARGILMMLSQLYKKGKRADLIPYGKVILDLVVNETKINESSNVVLRKLGVKLIQRIGLVFLKAKVAGWRYNRGNRSLALNLTAGTRSILISSAFDGDADDEDYDIPDDIEDVLEHLLTSLKDKDTVVRWSAAKGVGRLTARLPKELADDIIGSLLQLFSLHESDGAWHGGCLALAELGRRGLLLPQRLPEVIPVLIKSLVYDERRGNFSVGAHVRDAACYVCWSFARAYDPADIKPYAQKIASALIVVAVFDREVNVRRAASAAFQENVGRQGTFPHGIEILTACDFFAVGKRNYSYLELSKFVAGFPEYTDILVEHLLNYKVNHWDSEIRVLASQAIYSLAPVAHGFMLQVLPKLLVMAIGTDLNTRHGSIHAIGKLCLSLIEIGINIDENHLKAIISIEETLRSRKLLLGLGGEYMRKALCSMISDLSQACAVNKQAANFFRDNQVADSWQILLDECIFSKETEVLQVAIATLPKFLHMYLDSSGHVPDSIRDKIVESYVGFMEKSPTERSRMGAASALGCLPYMFLENKFDLVLTALIKCARISDADREWAEARRDAMKAVERICNTVGTSIKESSTQCLNASNVRDVYEAFLAGMDDYTIDSRGDVGAWVREACMTGILSLTSLLMVHDPSLLDKSLTELSFVKIAQQACEKIDRTRAHAGNTFASLLYLEPEVPFIPDRDTLRKIFPRDEVKHINFAAPSDTFHRFAQFLSLDSYRYYVLLGFAISVGGLTESLVKHSYTGLVNYIRSDSSTGTLKLKLICQEIITIFSNYQKNDRITLPLMKMVEQLLASGIFDDVMHDPEFTFPVELLNHVKAEVTKCSDPQKLLISIDVLCGLLIFEGQTRAKSLVQLSIFLCHRFPIVRKTTAKKLFESLIVVECQADALKQEQVMALLSDADWDESIDKLKPIRNEICDLLAVSRPKILTSKNQKMDQ